MELSRFTKWRVMLASLTLQNSNPASVYSVSSCWAVTLPENSHQVPLVAL